MQTVRAEAKGSRGPALPRHSTTAVKTAIPWWMWAGVAALLLFTLYSAWNSQRLQARTNALATATSLKCSKAIQTCRRKCRRWKTQMTDDAAAKPPFSRPRRRTNSCLAPQKIHRPTDWWPCGTAKWHCGHGQRSPCPRRNHVLQLWMIPKDPAAKPMPFV